MTTLADWQFELDGVPFGVGQSIAVSKFDRGGSDTRNQDQPAGWGDWVNFGTDKKTPGVWNWELFTDVHDATSALSMLEALEIAWDAEDTRATPGAVLPLRYTINGRTRRVYGRPRRFTATPQSLTTGGRIEAVADFQLAEAVYYDDAAESVLLSVGAADLDTGGVTFEVTFPFLWGGTAGTPGTRNILVGGSRRTWLTATITGPVTDPYVIVAGEVFQLRGAIPAGAANAVTVSSLPWEAGVYRAIDGLSAPVFLDATSRLAQLRVDPGQHLATFGGIDNTGTAKCELSWHNAHGSY